MTELISQAELERCMRAAIADPRKEPEFLRALLNATLFALRPVSDDSPNLRLMMFRRPDGLYFIPCFTNEAQAEEARGSAGQVVAFEGRLFFAISPGATFILNPNHESCTIYPEEITALLTAGAVAVVSQVTLTSPRDVLAGVPPEPPQCLCDALKSLYAMLPFVISAQLTEVRDPKAPDVMTLLVCLRTEPPHGERASRATIAALQADCATADLPVDVMVLNPKEHCEVAESGLLIYERDPSRSNTSEIAPGIPAKRARGASRS